MGGSCKDQKTALAICLQRSPCVLIERHTPKECISNPELQKQLPELCFHCLREFQICKSGFFDMRKRMRGNAPLSTGKYDEVYQNLSNGNFDACEEYGKLRALNKGFSKENNPEAKEGKSE